MRYAYNITNGRTTDIRCISESYVLKAGEYDGRGDKLPSPGELNHPDVLKEDRKIEAKVEAGKRIITILPEWKQRNLLARTAELIEEKADGGTLSSDEDTELTSMKALWIRIKAMRTASNAIEAEIDGLSTREEILDFDIVTNGLWPN
jgi:hypothetical protein